MSLSKGMKCLLYCAAHACVRTIWDGDGIRTFEMKMGMLSIMGVMGVMGVMRVIGMGFMDRLI